MHTKVLPNKVPPDQIKLISAKVPYRDYLKLKEKLALKNSTFAEWLRQQISKHLNPYEVNK